MAENGKPNGQLACYTGVALRSYDEKRRIILPANFRSISEARRAANGNGQDSAIYLSPKALPLSHLFWKDSFSSDEAALLYRTPYDRSGRVIINQNLMPFIESDAHKVLLVGCGENARIFSFENGERYLLDTAGRGREDDVQFLLKNLRGVND